MGFNIRTAIVIGFVVLLTVALSLEARHSRRRGKIGTRKVIRNYKDDSSCVGRCNDAYNASWPCACNSACTTHSDCCADYATVCGSGDTSCQGRCTIAYDSTLPCQCNNQCEQFTDCCADYSTYCSSSTITDQEIYDISAQVWTADAVNRVTPNLNWQGTVADGATTDNAPGPLFASLPAEFTTNALYAAQIALYPYFHPDENIAETITPAETSAIDNFLTLVMGTQVMQLVNTFLASKGLAPTDATQFQAQLKDIWYTLYERQNTLGSSGGEHVQSGEKEDGNTINGLHNWARFATQESAGSVNYLGYVRYEDLGGAYVIRNPFYWDGYYKPIGGFFIGTSPAFDMAIFTLCFYSRPNAICNVELNSIVVPIQTYTLDYNGGTYVGSSYPNY